jgi:hypothetical protein
MKHSTQYLFDKPRATYEPALTMVCKAKIRDANILLNKLVTIRDTLPLGKEKDALVERYKEVVKARQLWEDLLHEE